MALMDWLIGFDADAIPSPDVHSFEDTYVDGDEPDGEDECGYCGEPRAAHNPDVIPDLGPFLA